MGEQPLLPYESCNLGSINLVNMLLHDKKTGMYIFDFMKFRSVIKTAVRFLDNVIDANVYPISEIDAMTKKYRKIGLGVMGFGDMLYLMNVSYNSDIARDLARNIARKLTKTARETSIKLGIEKGSFPGIWEDFDYDKLPAPNVINKDFYSNIEHRHLRNAATTTIAPTGSISVIASVSSGIEPNYSLGYIRHVTSLDGTKYDLPYINGIFKSALIRELETEDGSEIYTKTMNKVITDKTVRNLDNVSEEFKQVFVAACSDDIHHLTHVAQQCAWQEYIDNAISKTVNCANGISVDDVLNTYRMAYNGGAKGITIYRDGSRDSQVLVAGPIESENDEGNKETEDTPVGVLTVGEPLKVSEPTVLTATNSLALKERPEVLQGFTFKINSGCGSLLVTVNYDSNGICEIIVNTGKSGGCASQSEATARMVSVALRAGFPIEEVIDQFRGIRCMSAVKRKDIKVTSCPDAIAKCIIRAQEMLASMQNSNLNTSVAELKSMCNETSDNICPDCGSPLSPEGGCNICLNCGYSKCNSASH